MPSRAMAVPTSDTIVFGGGLPDPRRHPTESLSTFLGKLLSTRDAASLSYSYGRGDTVNNFRANGRFTFSNAAGYTGDALADFYLGRFATFEQAIGEYKNTRTIAAP